MATPPISDWPAAWHVLLAESAVATALQDIANFLRAECAMGKIIYPPAAQRLRALELLAPSEAKVVILGQDPYHSAGQAEGLAFSVPPRIRIPPSLRNIYKELASDTGFKPPSHGHLAAWAGQGVLLLNAVLTVEAGRPNSHQRRGWETVTDAVIRHLAKQDTPIAFMLWGANAHKKAGLIAQTDQAARHLILHAAHPSPLSAYNGFFGCQHFSKANAFLKSKGLTPIDWQLPEAQ